MSGQAAYQWGHNKEMWELAYKPGSVEDNHSSTIFVTKYLKRPTQIPPRVTEYGFLFGLAPSGVYTATNVTVCAVRSYRTISPLPKTAVYFLLHFP